jgi:hypothetical protein
LTTVGLAGRAGSPSGDARSRLAPQGFIGSLWPVRDSHALLVMTAFYQQWRHHGLAPPAVLDQQWRHHGLAPPAVLAAAQR